MKIDTQQLTILGITLIGLSTNFVITACIIFAHIESIEVISLLSNVVVASVSALGGLYVGIKTISKNTPNEQTNYGVGDDVQ